MLKIVLLLGACVVFSVFAESGASVDDIPFPRSVAEAEELFKSGELPEAKSFKDRMVYEGKLYHLPYYEAGIRTFNLALVGSRGEQGPVQTWIVSISKPNEEKRDFYERIHAQYRNFFPTSENEFVTIPRPKALASYPRSFHYRVVKNKKGDARIIGLTKCALEKGCTYTVSWYEWECHTGPLGILPAPSRKVLKSANRIVQKGETLGWAIYNVESGEFASEIPPDKPKPKPGSSNP